MSASSAQMQPSALTTSHWQYWYGNPQIKAKVKQVPEDFIVEELPAYALTGEGEHIYLWLEKKNLNTAFVAEQLAKYLALPLRAVTYAGRKDKYALTRQYFAVHLPGKQQPDWDHFQLDGAKILSAKRHNKKLRTGSLLGNKFTLTLREVSDISALVCKLEQIQHLGVPNYYGEQRFGNNNSNLSLAELLIKGETIRNRNKRSMSISALRSWLFNEYIHRRLTSQLFDKPLSGDAMLLSGSNSFFICDQVDSAIEQRLQDKDILVSAPLWGQGELATKSQAGSWEASIAEEYPLICKCLAKLGLKQERRAIKVTPSSLNWKIDNDILTLSFTLPPGCFATSVLREAIEY